MALTFDDILAMAAFVQVVRTGSFTAAALELQTSKSQVSRLVAALERRLGARLMNRTSRSSSLTEAGQELYARASQMLAEAESAEQAVLRLLDRPRGTLRITAPAVLSDIWLTGVTVAFQQRFPEVRVELHLSDRFADLVDEGFDVAVRVGRLDATDLVARRLGAAPLRTVAAPGYLAAHDEPRVPADLARHNCLRYLLMDAQREWRFATEDGPTVVQVSGSFASNHGGALREATRAGAGICRLPGFLVDDDLARGTLVEVLPAHTSADSPGVWALWPHDRHPSPKVRAYVDFLALHAHRLGESDAAH